MSDEIANLPVTVVVARTVRAGRETEYEALLSSILKAALKYPAHLGVNVMRPRPGSREYTLVFRFDTVDNLSAWEESTARADWVAKVDPVTRARPTSRS